MTYPTNFSEAWSSVTLILCPLFLFVYQMHTTILTTSITFFHQNYTPRQYLKFHLDLSTSPLTATQYECLSSICFEDRLQCYGFILVGQSFNTQHPTSTNNPATSQPVIPPFFSIQTQIFVHKVALLLKQGLVIWSLNRLMGLSREQNSFQWN